jgi:transcription elongation GreA/GreB family factor
MADEYVDGGVLLKHARKRRYEDLEAAWMTAIEQGFVPLTEFLAVIAELAKQGELSRAEGLFWFLLTSLEERSGVAAALKALFAAAPILPQSAALRDEAVRLYFAAHAGKMNADDMETLAAMTLRRLDLPLDTAVAALEKFLLLRPGTYVFNTRSRKPGRVLDLDREHRLLRVSLGDVEVTCDAQSLDRLVLWEPDDFRALVVFDRARLERLATEEPAELVRLVLRAHGPQLTLRELRAHLADVLPEGAWSAWWGEAKAHLLRHPLIEVAGGTQPVLTLRRQALSHEAEAKARFDAAPDPEAKLMAVIRYLSERTAMTDSASGGSAASGQPDETLAAHLSKGLREIAEAERESLPAVALAALDLLDEMRNAESGMRDGQPNAPVDVPHSALRNPHLLQGVQEDAVARRALSCVRRAQPGEWPAMFAAAMPEASESVCGWAAQALTEAGHASDLAAAAAAILERRDRAVGALIWLWNAVSSGAFEEALAPVGPLSVLVRLLVAAEEIGRASKSSRSGGQVGTDPNEQTSGGQSPSHRRSDLAEVRAALSSKALEAVRRALEPASEREADQVRKLVERNAGLSDHARTGLLGVVRSTHPALFVEHLPPWEEDIVYTTEAGLKKQQMEFEHLIHVRLPENSRAIGVAAARGDLSENAEFTAALEDRDRLTERANRMQADLAKARLITHALADSPTVTVGSAVLVKDLDSGATETFTFLGPWDVNPEQGIYSYRARLGMAFMGKAVGERVTMPVDSKERRWEILGVRPAV